ncbi:MAG: hypothetical protein Kow0059_03260 [Candidatus Sumerlaeia bacterium]
MRQHTRLLIVSVFLGTFTLLSVGQAAAAGPLYKKSYTARATHKLIRGLVNIPFSWVEIPLQINEDVRNTAPLPGTISGTGKGLWKSVKRFGFSVWEVATFWTGNVDEYKHVTKSEFPTMSLVE